MPAEKNDILGLTAYITNPKNPLEPEGSPNLGLPLEPVSQNAVLTVTKDGRRSLAVPLPNPVFTVMSFGDSPEAAVLETSRNSATYGPHTGGRITSVTFGLGEASEAVFASSHIYAVPLQTDKIWDLHLKVDVLSAVKTGEAPEPPLPPVEPEEPGTEVPAEAEAGKSDDGLASTGSQPAGIAIFAGTLLLAGAAVVTLSARRRVN